MINDFELFRILATFRDRTLKLLCMPFYTSKTIVFLVKTQAFYIC